MKFKLVEEPMTSTYFSILADKKYNPSSFLSLLSKRRRELLEDALFDYYQLHWKMEGKDAKQATDSILTNNIAHHLDGVHKTGVPEKNELSNIVLIPESMHSDVTATNKEIIRELSSSIIINDIPEINELLQKLLITCYVKNVHPSTLLKISTREYTKELLKFREKVSEDFKSKYPKKKHQNIVYLDELNLQDW